MNDLDRFLKAKDLAGAKFAEDGIGTYSEKMLHRTLKFYFEPNSKNHEILFLGSVADIKNSEEIVEIQTKSFNKLVPKLEKFLPVEKVRVIYPIIEHKLICRIDEKTGESLPPTKSTKRGRAWNALPELAQIVEFIPHDNLSVTLVFLDVTETRLLHGKIKVGSKKTSKIDVIPTALNSTVDLIELKDFLLLLPPKIPSEFTSADFEKITKLHGIQLHNSLIFLVKIGILTREKRGGRAYIYSVNPDISRAT